MLEEEKYYLYNSIEEYNPPEELSYILKYFRRKYYNVIKHLIKFGNIDNVTKFQGIKLTKKVFKLINLKYKLLIKEMNKAEVNEDYERIALIKNGDLVLKKLM